MKVGGDVSTVFDGGRPGLCLNAALLGKNRLDLFPLFYMLFIESEAKCSHSGKKL